MAKEQENFTIEVRIKKGDEFTDIKCQCSSDEINNVSRTIHEQIIETVKLWDVERPHIDLKEAINTGLTMWAKYDKNPVPKQI